MNLIRKITVLALTSLFLVGCASSSNHTTDNTDTNAREKNIDEQLKDISASAEAKKLLATETDEEKLREKLVCKREKVIGTHFKKKVCRTQAEIDALREATKRDVDSAQRVRDYDPAN